MMDPLATTKIIYLVFGALTIVGGLMGFLKAKSQASLIAGGLSGALLIVAALLLPTYKNLGLSLGILVSIPLVGQFAPKLLRKDFRPHVIISVVFGLIAIGVAITAGW